MKKGIDFFSVSVYTDSTVKVEVNQGGKTMTFENTLKAELIKAYTDTYGADAWNRMTEQERSNTLHELLGSFLTVVKNRIA